MICSKPLFAIDEPTTATKPESEHLAAAAGLAERQPPRRPPAELDTVLATHKRITSILSLIPLWGLWRLSRSEQHNAQEKFTLGFASVFLSVLAIVLIVALLPTAEQRSAERRTRIEAEIQTLRRLTEGYLREHGALPDRSAWQRSAASGDLRFYDPWGRAYHYEPTPDGFMIGTYGRDAVAGGEGEDADVLVEFPRSPAPGAAPAPRIAPGDSSS